MITLGPIYNRLLTAAILICGLCTTVSAQNNGKVRTNVASQKTIKTQKAQDVIYDKAERMPSFYHTGDASLEKWLKDNITYPQSALDNGAQGTVKVRFTVEDDGSIDNITVTESASPELDWEAVRAISNMPKWTPGTKDDKPVPVWVTKDITFNILDIQHVVHGKQKLFVIDGKKQDITVLADFYFLYNQKLQSIMSNILFDKNGKTLRAGFDSFLGNYEIVRIRSQKSLQKKDNTFTFSTTYNGTELADERYVPFTYKVAKETKIYSTCKSGYFTFDNEKDNLLTVTDVFTPTTITSLGLTGKETSILVDINHKSVSYWQKTDDTETTRVLASIEEHPEMFTNEFVENLNMEHAKIAKIRERTQTADIVGVKYAQYGKTNLAQTKKEVVADEKPKGYEKPYDIVAQMPEFPGGDAKLKEWLNSHIIYPAIAEENGVQGRVIVRFVVGKDGSISNTSVVRSVDPSLDKEALRVVKAMPKWIPGYLNDAPVPVWFTLPVTFQLQ